MSVPCPPGPCYSSATEQLAPFAHLWEVPAPSIPGLGSINLFLEQGSFFTPSSPSSSSLG